MKSIILITIVGLLSTTVSRGQIKNAKTEVLKVYGNCNMCETTIEKVGSKSKLYETEWNVDTKMASITYDSKKTNADAVLKNIALSGYDNANYLAPGDTYGKLPACCKYDRLSKTAVTSSNNMNGNASKGHTGQGHEKYTISAEQSSQLKVVFDHYFTIKDALVKTDGNTASAAAAALLTALDAVDMGKLKAEEHTVWMKVEKAFKTDAQHIKENKDIGHQREHFISLSTNMYELIKAAKLAETVYYQFCPMANDGKGANWLSKESVIKNPYYGSQMLSCGKVVETIKQ